MTELEIQEKIWEIEREYPNLHIDLDRDQISYGDVKELCRLYKLLNHKRTKGTNEKRNRL